MSVFIALPAIDVHNYNHQVEAKKSKSVRSFGHGNNDLSNNEQSIQICCGWGAE